MGTYDPDSALRALEPWRKLANELERENAALADERFSGASVSGTVTAEVNGDGTVLDLRIAPEALRGKAAQLLGDDVVEAVRSARSTAAEVSRVRYDEVRKRVSR